jgi:acylaminoacyl-peptidase
MIMVNYRGSVGSGQASVDFLLGRVGTTDVEDMHQAAKHVLANNPNISSEKCVLFGGSHGGFLVLHLSGQFPVSIITYFH